MITFGALVIGYKQKVVSKSKFIFMYFPIWALAVTGTVLFIMGEEIEALVVLLLIGFPRVPLAGNEQDEQRRTQVIRLLA